MSLQSTLFKQAFELGAISTSDFTDRVTHLIASAHGGAKYMASLTTNFAEPTITRIFSVRSGTKDSYHDI